MPDKKEILGSKIGNNLELNSKYSKQGQTKSNTSNTNTLQNLINIQQGNKCPKK